ncbi:MAG: radical SAM protein [Calditrichota bacterium]
MIPSPATKSLLIRERLPELQTLLDPCRLCPRECMARRKQGETGECGIADTLIVSSIGLHHGEEYPISGTDGSGTIFLSGCNLHCVFCQNWEISQTAIGQPLSPVELAQAMLNLQASGAHNINWVSPTHVTPLLLDALRRAYDDGLKIPLIYNTGGYDSLDVLEMLDGIVDIYMPDMKYGNCDTAQQLSGIEDYVEVNQSAVQEMYRQVGSLQCDRSGVAYRGLLVRHLLLPDNLAASETILAFLSGFPGPVDVNIMDQYRPCHHAEAVFQLARRINRTEFEEILQLVRAIPNVHLVE